MSIDIAVRSDGRVFLSQRNYCDEILEKWGLAQANGISGLVLDKESYEPFGQEEVDGTEDEAPLLSDVRMAQRVAGGLLWLASWARPDVAYATSRVAALATSRPLQALVFGKKVLRYLAGFAPIARLGGGAWEGLERVRGGPNSTV